MSHARCALLGLGLLGSLACDGSARERDEARRFLTSYNTLDHRDPRPQRERDVGALAALPLFVASVVHARDACVFAHRALMSAEQAQEGAAAALDAALRDQPDGEPLGKVASERVQQRIVEAELALSGARTQFTPCEAEARSLALRFAAR